MLFIHRSGAYRAYAFARIEVANQDVRRVVGQAAKDSGACEPVELAFQVPANATQVHVGAAIYGAGNLLVDAVALESRAAPSRSPRWCTSAPAELPSPARGSPRCNGG